MIIRRMTEEDMDQVLCIEDSCFTDAWSHEDMYLSFRDDTYDFFVASENDKVAGYACMYTVMEEADVGSIAVLPEYRKSGIGRMLLDRLLAKAKENGAETMFLEVRASNVPAIRLYETTGFVCFGERRNYYRDPVENALVYRLKLTN